MTSENQKKLRKLDIFISSPGDVQEEREIAIKVIHRLNSLPQITRQFVLKPLAYEKLVPPAIGQSPANTIDRYMMEAGNADIYICILWHRWGTPVIDDKGKEYESGTMYEFENAYRANLEKRKPRMLLYRCLKQAPLNADTEQIRHVDNFFSRFVGKKADLKGLYGEFKNNDEFEQLFFDHLNTVIATDFDKLEEEPLHKRRDFYQHISLPANYVAREELLVELREAILEDRSNVALTSAIKAKPTALHGMGGIGKSVMARALCEDPQAQAAFPDGILWATLGKEPNLAEQMRQWIIELRGTIPETAPTLEQLKANLAKLLATRACLLIVDDVWQRKHAEAFRVGGPQCRLVITTRDAEVAAELNAKVLPVPLMTRDQAVLLLEEWADEKLYHIDRAQKERIVERLGRLPIALKLAGAQLRRKDVESWVVSQFEVKSAKSSISHNLFVSPAAIAGVTRKVLWILTKL